MMEIGGEDGGDGGKNVERLADQKAGIQLN